MIFGGYIPCRTRNNHMNTVKSGKLKVQYSTHGIKRTNGTWLRLKNYKQQDAHSCGFLAALTVVRYFKLIATDEEVLAAVRPTINKGVDNFQIVSALERLGVSTTYREDLTVGNLRKYIERGIPVIISVWPDDWPGDHWTVVQGFNISAGRVYLTNHPSLTKKLFRKQWIENWEDGSTRGAGLICLPGG